MGQKFGSKLYICNVLQGYCTVIAVVAPGPPVAGGAPLVKAKSHAASLLQARPPTDKDTIISLATIFHAELIAEFLAVVVALV